MGRFCTECGRPLQEGEICSCQLGKEGQKVVHLFEEQQQLGEQQMSLQQTIEQQIPSHQKKEEFESQQVPTQQQRESEQIPPQQQVGGQQIPPQQQVGGQQIPPQQQVGGQQIPPQQQVGGQQIPPQQQVGGQQIPPQQPMWEQAASPKSTAIQEFFQKFVGYFFHLIKKPVSTGRDMLVEADVKISFIFIVVQGIFSAFFALADAKRCSTYIFAFTGMVDNRIRNRTAFTELWTIPYNRIFIVTVLVSIILSCILALLLLIGHLISKCMVSYRQMLSAVAIRSAVLVPAILASLILFELHSGIGIFMFFAVNIWGFVTMLLTMSSFIPDYKKNIFAFMISGVIIMFILVVIFMISKMWTLYLPDVMRTAIDSIQRSGNNVSDLLSDLLMNFY